jgi:TolB-like protein
MQIWSAEIKELESLYTSIKGRFPELEKELERLIKTKDANVILIYSRRCLEVIITDLCEEELKRPRKTEPLKGIIDKLSHEEKVPSHIIASMEGLNSLSTFGAHPKDFDPEQVRPILLNLATIIKWYVKFKDTKTNSEAKPEEAKYESTEPVDDRVGIPKPKKKLILLLSGLLVVMTIVVVLFVFKFIGSKKIDKELEKTIAVLPFVNDSKDDENTYFINGIMDEVLLNLQAIKDLKVPGRTSVEQYRNPTKSIPEIAKELGVNYIVEGSGQKYGNTVRLRIQLLEGAKGYHLWGDSYEQTIESPEAIFRIQSQIAQAIADELKALITPEEKQLIEKASTTSLTAYDFFQKGREEHWKYWNNNDTKALEKAEDLYHEALKYDSKFAQAYTGLAWVYWDKHYWESILSEDFMDSVLILCDIALSYDNQLSEAYTIKGNYYDEIGKKEQAIKEFDKAVTFNPNDWIAYMGRGSVYVDYDLVMSIENYQKAISLNHGSQLPGLLRSIAAVYLDAGFIEKAKNYDQEAFELDEDSLRYYWISFGDENIIPNYAKAIEFLQKIYLLDSSNIDIYYRLGEDYMFLGQHEESLKYFIKWLQRSETLSDETLFGTHRVGWAYWQNGYKEKAEYYFNELIRYCDRLKKMGRYDPFRPEYDLAAVYAFTGNREKAYENLRLWAKMPSCQLWWLIYLKNDPFFDSIRNEPEFQQIVGDYESKYQAEHERVRKWLEEQGML